MSGSRSKYTQEEVTKAIEFGMTNLYKDLYKQHLGLTTKCLCKCHKPLPEGYNSRLCCKYCGNGTLSDLRG